MSRDEFMASTPLFYNDHKFLSFCLIGYVFLISYAMGAIYRPSAMSLSGLAAGGIDSLTPHPSASSGRQSLSLGVFLRNIDF
jgi:hypothetical protein